MFDNLGANPAGSVLAAIATACCLLPIILIKCGPKWRGSSPSSGGLNGEEEETRVEKKAKPKKTVRWGDETDSSTDGSETKSEVPTEQCGTAASSETSTTETESGDESPDIAELSRLETQIETRDFATPEEISAVETKNENGNENEGLTTSRTTTKESESESESESDEIVRVETKGSGSSGGDGGGAEGKRKEREAARVDDHDDGAAGDLGMDVGRLAVFPFL